MSRRVRIDLFCEDHAHEQFLRHLVGRVCCEEGVVMPHLAVRSARGGRAKPTSELQTFQDTIRKGLVEAPDLLVIGIDANCDRYPAVREEVLKRVDANVIPRCAVACADPHIERWYLADVTAFQRVVGSTPDVPQDKCERDFYKNILSNAIARAGHPPTLGGIEFARELAEDMDLYDAGRTETSLKHFLDDLRVGLRGLLDTLP